MLWWWVEYKLGLLINLLLAPPTQSYQANFSLYLEPVFPDSGLLLVCISCSNQRSMLWNLRKFLTWAHLPIATTMAGWNPLWADPAIRQSEDYDGNAPHVWHAFQACISLLVPQMSAQEAKVGRWGGGGNRKRIFQSLSELFWAERYFLLYSKPTTLLLIKL